MTTDAVVTRTVAELDEAQRQAIRRRQRNRILTHVLAVFVAAWILLPILLIAGMAFSTVQGVRSFPKPIVPQPFSTETMDFFLNSQDVIPSTGRSIVVALITVVLSTIVSAPAGYALSRYVFRGRDVYRLTILSTRAFPIVILAIPLAVMFINLQMRDSLLSLALMHTALSLPTSILVIASVFASVPRELEEAAMVFGASPVQSFLRIVMPLTAPGVAAAAIFTFVLSWNEVFAAVILTIRNRTLPAQIFTALGQSPLEYRFAGAFFMMIPALIFIFFVRKYLFNMWGQVTK
ncbi:MAG: carbohydrate ABC transporter permease [Anaerolineae bacterium]|nr:carbohydrate ABC transporter permease [Anaerolineae bacterium]